MKKFLWMFIFLVSWKVSTCNIYVAPIPKDLYEDDYGAEHGTHLSCEVTEQEKRKFFKIEKEVVKFVENAPGWTSDFKIQEAGE